MIWFTSKVSQEDLEQFKEKVLKITENQYRTLYAEWCSLKVRVAELENSNKPLARQPLAGTPIKRQEDRTLQCHSNVTHTYTDSFPDLSTAMLVSALVSDSSSSSSGSCDSYSSSSCDSSSSCGGE